MSALQKIMRLMLIEKKDISVAVVCGFIAGISSVGLFAASGYLISKSALIPPFYTLIILTSTVKLLGLVKAGAKYGERLSSHRATFTILSNLRVAFFEKLTPLIPQIFHKYRSGDLLARVVGDVESLQNFFLRVFYPPLVLLLVFVSTILFTSFYSIAIALILLLGFFLTTIIIPALFSLKQVNIKGKVRQERGDLSIHITEMMYGFRELKLFHQLPHKQQQLLNRSESYINEQKRENLNKVSSQSFNGFITLVTSWFVIGVGAYLVANGMLEGIFLAMLVMISLTVFESAASMAVFPIYMQESRDASRRLYEVVEDPSYTKNHSDPDINKLSSLPPSLEFKDVQFTYMGDWRSTIPNISFTIPARSKTAIVGASGSGKSTVLQLILKLQEVDAGKIYWGDLDISSVSSEAIWEQTKVVLQENYYFYGTIRENLQLAASELNDTQMEAALAKVQLEHFSLDHRVLEKGENLSGGEKQRLALARAFLKKGHLWLLDEPTSSLDAQTEQTIYKEIFKDADQDTFIMVSHRLKGLESMDQIIVMNHGEIMEYGSYKDLMEKKGYFYQMKVLEESLL
ncbi:cysteine ABC transporter permease/ATP-binding protein [Niallia circulans]|uniref:thiol reductant ABC exporter subunit CydC n=1 Tax=Niallia circulans TaxID=1397 RepID=UPI00077CD5E1|nr:thiol reductant ABC exporter subunit CydC [Niallia circulans]MDR4318540.1 thiol reductant ABC exporter subunit CydC [Niallia circulans]MED3839629.1 thiol reductant ABC exporter subunit CydC [Niallia circulans]MED4243442.1 thiol reductant ABC exporter subunit CydC [Niallia circulans]MED4247588.1 thiol reductant ABC exporter subunit CydC [Niallia circulans]QKH62917.1 thiol reductant ABC exporter subunit CydC [Niallia circulans]